MGQAPVTIPAEETISSGGKRPSRLRRAAEALWPGLFEPDPPPPPVERIIVPPPPMYRDPRGGEWKEL